MTTNAGAIVQRASTEAQCHLLDDNRRLSRGWRNASAFANYFLHDHQIFARGPAFAQPEGTAGGVGGVEENAAFLDTVPAEARERFVDQPAAEAPPAVRGNDGQVVEISAPAVMPAKDGADDAAVFVQRDEAQAGIAHQKGGDRLPRIGFIQTDAGAGAPQRDDGVIVGGREIAQPIGGWRGMREGGNGGVREKGGRWAEEEKTGKTRRRRLKRGRRSYSWIGRPISMICVGMIW